MTDQEARSLRPGERMEILLTAGGPRRWVPALVTKVRVSIDVDQFRVWAYFRPAGERSDGRGPSGRMLPVAYRKRPDCIRRPPNFDPLPANVYADWLDERGFADAARALREAFPLA